MAKRKNEKPQRSKTTEDVELKALYAKMRKAFTAADLQKYTVIEKGIPAEEVVAEMEKIHRQFSKKKGLRNA
jgi:predicted metalloprotease